MSGDQKPDPSATTMPRLKLIDGLRGLAALYVTLYHVVADVNLHGAAIRLAASALQFGHFAVGVFIVVSGYCLMAPVAMSADGNLPGGLRSYARRRMRRILPAYYAVLIPAIIAVAIARGHHMPSSPEEADVLRLSAGTVLSHLFLVHNLHSQWASAFDPPMWSVAAECQIYVLFPLVLLPVWWRAGAAGLIVVAFALGLAPHFCLPAAANLDWTCPWYLGLFSLGMMGAVVSFSARQPSDWRRRHVPWGTLASALSLAAAIAIISRPAMPLSAMWLPDILVGCAVAAGLIRLTALRTSRPAPRYGNSVWTGAIGLLESRSCVSLGACSYSLYLLHAPVLWAVSLVASMCHANEDQSTMVRLLAGVPLAVIISHMFFLFVERRAMAPKR